MNFLKYLKSRFGGIAGSVDWSARNVYNIDEKIKFQLLNQLLSHPKYADDKCLTKYGYKFYSQNYEDGILREIFSRIGTKDKTFVEFGVEDGLENNTLALLFEGWKGLWIECDKTAYKKIVNGFRNAIGKGALKVENAFVSKENINEIISRNIESSQLDLLVIDIDGNDYHIFDAITVVTPRVIVFEYNAKFPSHISFCVDYEPELAWDGTDYFGASLKFFVDKLSEKGYSLVGCGITGFNCFFVRNDLLDDKFLSPYTAEKHYEPVKGWLGKPTSGHKASAKSLDTFIKHI